MEITKQLDKLFGIWKNRKDIEDVEQYVRKIRKGRYKFIPNIQIHKFRPK